VNKYPPKHCPECGGTNINAVPLWANSGWKADPKNPDWIPFQGTSYDTWCDDCEVGFHIEPGEERDTYWFDEHPEDLPPEGNKIYTDALLRRSPPDERCGNCGHFFSGFKKIDGKENSTLEISCDVDKSRAVKYFRPCIYDPSKWVAAPEPDDAQEH